MEYRALALDLDGTLTDSNKQITAYTKEILGEAMVRGVKVILASGRPVLGIQSVAVALGLEERGGYILAYNGGQIVDCGTGRVIFEKLVPTKYFSDICAIARSFGAQPLTYSEDMVVAESEADLYVQKEAYNNSAAVRVVERVDCAIRQPVPKYMVVGENDKLKQVRECMKKSFEGKLDVFFSEPYFLEVVPVGIEKAKALDILLKELDLAPENLMAFGDGLNDIPMLKYAGFSVAMQNACPEVKREADYITLSNDEDGVARAVKMLLLDRPELLMGGRNESIDCNCNL